MGRRSGNKRKKDTNSPNSGPVSQENKRIMVNYSGYCVTSPVQGLSQPQAGQSNSHIAPATFNYTPATYSNGTPIANMPQPPSPGMQIGGPDQGVMSMILQRLDDMDKKLGHLECIQSSISSITVKVSDIEVKVKNLETKVNTIENSRDFDSEAVEHLNKKQKEIDDLLSKMKNLEESQSKTENELKSQVLDMQCRSMRNNLIFYRIPEQREETDDDCVQKILTFIEDNLKIQNARTEIKLHRAHRMGRFNPSKIRPIIAKFAFFPDREKVRKSAGLLKNTNFDISQQFPKEIMDTRKKLVPIMKAARGNGQDAYIVVDKLYIDKVLYREPLP